jgi:phospholipase/carboxylesterase
LEGSAAALANLDPPVRVEPPERADASIVFLHGLGADGHDFEPIVPELGLERVRTWRFVFPHAPRIPVTVNGGMMMRAWYDIADVAIERRTNPDHVRRSARIAEALIEQEVAAGIAPERIVLAGFSQGGAIALHAGLRHRHRLAGILALSAYLPLAETLAAEASAANREIPIFLGHGSQDPVVPLALSARARDAMTRLGYVIEVHTYPMPHSVCPEEIRDISDWLARTL